MLEVIKQKKFCYKERKCTKKREAKAINLLIQYMYSHLLLDTFLVDVAMYLVIQLKCCKLIWSLGYFLSIGRGGDFYSCWWIMFFLLLGNGEKRGWPTWDWHSVVVWLLGGGVSKEGERLGRKLSWRFNFFVLFFIPFIFVFLIIFIVFLFN